MKIDTEKLTNAEGLRQALFAPEARPCIRWVWSQAKKRNIPTIKIGGKVFFDPVAVRECWEKKKTIKARLRPV